MRRFSPLDAPPAMTAELLRADAEARALRVSAGLPLRPQAELTHELLVHQIELEMQNDELRRALEMLETARDRYVDLYDFAPVGYATLNGDGEICEINLTGARLLDVERRSLVGQRFARYVWPADGDRWHGFAVALRRQMQPGGVELALKRPRDQPVPVLINGRCDAGPDGSKALHISLSDLSASRKAEAALLEASQLIDAVKDSVPDHIALLDGLGGITMVNSAWQEFADLHGTNAFGSVPRSAVGSNYVAECSGNGQPQSSEADHAAVGIVAVLTDQQDLFTCDYACDGPDGRHWFHMSVTPLHTAGRGAVVVHADITPGLRHRGTEHRAVPLERFEK